MFVPCNLPSRGSVISVLAAAYRSAGITQAKFCEAVKFLNNSTRVSGLVEFSADTALLTCFCVNQGFHWVKITKPMN